MNQRAVRVAVATALLAGFAAPVLATTQASISLSEFAFTLKDLSPNDGQAPAPAWSGSPWLSVNGTEQQQQGWLNTSSASYVSLQSLWQQSANVSASGPVPQLNMPTPMSFGQLAAKSDGTMSLSMAVPAGYSGYASAWVSRSFTLSAGSQVTFSYAVNGDLSGVGGTALLTGGGWAAAKSNASFNVQLGVGATVNQLSSYGSSDWFFASDAHESAIDGQTSVLTLRNTDSVAKTYSLFVTSSLNVSETLAPVPEPTSYALMGLGLLALGGVIRRRR